MLQYPDRDGWETRERLQTLIAEADEWRLAREAEPKSASLAQRAAQVVGRALVATGANLLRYGRTDGAMIVELRRPSPRSAPLN